MIKPITSRVGRRQSPYVWLGCIAMLLWIALIFHWSSQTYAQQSIQPWLRALYTSEQLAAKLPDWTIHYLGAEVSAKQRPFTFVEFFVRKGAHISMYAMLALLSYWVFAIFIRKTRWTIAAVVIVVLLVGSLDEWNQSFMTARTGVPQDIGIDLLGACLVILLMILIQWWRKRWRKWKPSNESTK